METKKTARYSKEFQYSSAELALHSEQSINAVARELGVNHNTLHGWVKKYFPERKASVMQGTIPMNKDEELRHLRQENHRLRQEAEILKKAAAYFVREQR